MGGEYDAAGDREDFLLQNNDFSGDKKVLKDITCGSGCQNCRDPPRTTLMLQPNNKTQTNEKPPRRKPADVYTDVGLFPRPMVQQQWLLHNQKYMVLKMTQLKVLHKAALALPPPKNTFELFCRWLQAGNYIRRQ